MSKLDRLDIKQLRVFQALIREENASKAANQLGMTQQAVSEHLKKLREVFDDRLFVRKTNGFVPTTFAQELSVGVDRLLIDFNLLLSKTNFVPEKAKGTFVIAATDYAQQIILPSLIAKLRERAPELKLIVRDFEIDNLHELMESGKVNLAIVSLITSQTATRSLSCLKSTMFASLHLIHLSLKPPRRWKRSRVIRRSSLHHLAQTLKVRLTNGLGSLV